MRMQGRWCVLLAAWCAAGTVVAAELEVRVEDRRGAPVADAVVTLLPREAGPQASVSASAPVPSAKPHVIDQKALAFTPYVEVLRPG